MSLTTRAPFPAQVYKFLVTGFVNIFAGPNGETTPAQAGFCGVVTIFSLFVLQQCQPYAAESSDRTMVLARLATTVVFFNAMALFADDDTNTKDFQVFTSFMVVLVPTIVVGQLLYEFLLVPTLAMREEHPEIGLCTARF